MKCDIIQNAFIHLFEAGGMYYLFDVNTDKILNIPYNVYVYLKNDSCLNESEEVEVECYLKNLIRKNFLKSKKVQISENPETEFLEFYLKKQMSSLILQVTQNCNLRCEYCIYSGSYYNRKHSNKRMTYEMAKRCINYFAEHSKERESVHIGFYGGEPLLEFELMKQCIEYAKYRFEGKKVYFNFTTNGTLVTPEIIEFCQKNNVAIMFSLDGPKSVHDLSRKYCNNQGSFDVLYENLNMIKSRYPKFFEEKVLFNTVLNSERSYSCIADYFSGDELLKNSTFVSSFINPINSKNGKKVTDQFYEEFQYEYFLFLLSKIKQISEEAVSPLGKINGKILSKIRYQKNLEDNKELPMKHHHGGPCLAGVYRLFVTVEGKFYPCEKVSETDDYALIGDIENGIDIEKVKNIINIEQLTSEECRNCWAYNYCSICIAQIDITHEKKENAILKRCSSVRTNVEDKFKDYCVLKQYGYQM